MLDFKEQLMAIKTEMNKKELNKDNKLINNGEIKAKIEVKDLDTNKQIKIEINTNDKNIHNNINKDIVMNKLNYNNQIKKDVKKGQLWYVDFGKRQGSLQSGIRPALVDSNDVNNKFSNIINVYPLTSSTTKANIPVHVTIEGYNLKEKSTILIEQGTPIDVRFQLLTYIGTVDELILKKVKKARDIQLGNLVEKNALEKLSQDIQSYIINKLNMIEQCKNAIELYQIIKGNENNSIDWAEDEKFREENALMYYCDKNKINYEEIYDCYLNMKGELNNDTLAL